MRYILLIMCITHSSYLPHNKIFRILGRSSVALYDNYLSLCCCQKPLSDSCFAVHSARSSACLAEFHVGSCTLQEVLRVCQCPLQLTHLLQKFAPSVSKGQGSKDEKLLLNIARAINNLAMDLKSQSQLEVGTLKSLQQVFCWDVMCFILTTIMKKLKIM